MVRVVQHEVRVYNALPTAVADAKHLHKCKMFQLVACINSGKKNIFKAIIKTLALALGLPVLQIVEH